MLDALEVPMIVVQSRSLAAAMASALALPSLASAAEPYCQDNPAIIYCNDFESGVLDGLEAGPAATVVAGTDGGPTYEGEYSLHADFSPPYNAQAEFGVRFPGVQQVYFRFYVRFDATWDQPMSHWYAIHGDHPDDPWSCHGNAGCRPNGLMCLSGTTVDTRQSVDGELPGEPFFYTYYPEMNCDPGDTCANYADPQAICDGCADKGLPCENGLECCWGNWFNINQSGSVSMVQDTWYEVETMVLANTPGVADGEMALWIDGQLVAQHEDIRWRDLDELLLNHVIVWNYFPDVPSSRSVWFDNLVVSTEPIGGVAGGGDTTGGSGGPGTDTGGDVTGADTTETGAMTTASGGATAGNTDGSGSGAPTTTASGGATAGNTDGVGSGAAVGTDDEGGCACRNRPRSSPWGALLLLGLVFTRRRSP